MNATKETKDVQSPYSVVVPNDHLASYCRKGYMRDLNKIAMVDLETGEEWMYRKVESRRLWVAGELQRLGVVKGDRVAVLMHNCLEFAPLVLALASIGACAVLINQQSTLRELTAYLSMSSCKLIVTSVLHAGNVAQLVKTQASSLQHALVVKDERYECLMQHQCAISPGHEPSKNSTIANPLPSSNGLPIFILFSSGTTGTSKGVVLSHRSVVGCVCQYRHPSFNWYEDPRNSLIFQPLAHGYGMSRMLYCLSTTTTILLLSKFKLHAFLAAIQKYKLKTIHIVPPIAVMLTQSDLASKFDLSSLRYIYSSAAPMSGQLEEKLQKILPGVQILQGYALTECAGVGTQVTVEGVSQAPRGSVGFLYPNTTCRIIDPDTKEVCGVCEEGELLIRGPQTMMGYLNDKEATRATLDNEGFVHTGDCGYYDDKGFFFITDRLKEMIKYNGLQVAPAELEGLLLSHPDIDDVAVVGMPSEMHGQLPHAWVVLKEGSTCSEVEVAKWIEDKVAPYKRLRGGVRFVKSIPKSPSGKILRRQIRDVLKKAKL